MEENSWRGMWCIEVVSAPGDLVLFGAAGDLAARKLYPALFELFRLRLIHEESSVIGCARRDWTEEAYRDYVAGTLPGDAPEAEKTAFLEHFSYIAGDYADPGCYEAIGRKLAEFDARPSAAPRNRLFYLALSSALYADVVARLDHAGLLAENDERENTPWRHVLLEKPFGRDLESARELARKLHRHLREEQIYRIDHYLGKETVQNITMLRFANRIFEPIWNSEFIESVQITAAETLGVGHRAGYYDTFGCLRDMFQNHMLAILGLAAMEIPREFTAEAMRQETLKLIRSVRPFPKECPARDFVRGQYRGYRDEPGVAPDSKTETYVAAPLYIDNWRWRDVPFFLRSGKMLGAKKSEVAIRFKAVPHSIFYPISSRDLGRNELVLHIQPEEGMSLTLQSKQPGPKLCMGEMTLGARYGESREPYARLILDALLGDQTLFLHSDVIEASWKLFTPVLDCWAKDDCSPLRIYEPGSAGPLKAEKLTEWREL